MENADNKDNLKIILDESSDLSLNQIRRLLNKMSPSEIAHALESSPPKQRGILFSLLKTDEEGDVLFELGEEIQQDLVSKLSNKELIEAVKELELDEIVDILQNLPEERMKKILSNMSLVDRKRIEMGLTYPDNTAGGLLNTDVISVRPNNSVEVVISYLRDQGELPENTDKIFVVNNDNEYLGELSISTIITSNPSMIVKDIMDEDLSPLKTDQDDKEVAIIFERNDGGETCLPVLVKEPSPFNQKSITYKSETDLCYIFPGWFKHRVTENTSKKDRLSISFNYGAWNAFRRRQQVRLQRCAY